MAALFLACGLCGCEAPAAAPDDGARTVKVYRYAGSRQCEKGGLAPADLERQLSIAGVRARSTRCALDGKAYGAACGMGDGRIIVAEIEAKQLGAARKLGLAPLAELPEARDSPCR